MTLETMIQTNLSKWRTNAAENLTVSDAENNWSVQFSADKCDELGCRLTEVSIQRLAETEEVTLQGWAERIAAGKIATDALRVVEVDNQRGEAVVRSETPTVKGDKRAYFEVVVQGTKQAVLRRYETSSDASHKRQQVGFVVTHETAGNAAQVLTGESA